MSPTLPPLRSLLPAEHGSWFMLGFPVALGLLLRPGWAAASLAGAGLACFLARPSLRRVLNGQRDPRSFRALGLLTGTAGFLGSLALALSGPRFLIPLAWVSPLIAVALRADRERNARTLPIELAAQGAFAGLAAVMDVASGGTGIEASRIWLLVTLVGSANLAHVRHLLGHAHHLPPAECMDRRRPVHALHLLLIAVSAALFHRSLPGLLWTTWTLLLYGRALAPYRAVPARTLGWREGGLSILGLLILWRALR